MRLSRMYRHLACFLAVRRGRLQAKRPLLAGGFSSCWCCAVPWLPNCGSQRPRKRLGQRAPSAGRTAPLAMEEGQREQNQQRCFVEPLFLFLHTPFFVLPFFPCLFSPTTGCRSPGPLMHPWGTPLRAISVGMLYCRAASLRARCRRRSTP